MKLFQKVLLYIGVLVIFVGGIYSSRYTVYFKGRFLYINNEKYVEASGIYEESNKKICDMSDGYDIYEVVGDTNHNYVVVRSFLDQRLYVKGAYVPDKSTIVGIHIGNNDLSYTSESSVISCILSLNANEVYYDYTEEYVQFHRKNGKAVSVKYDNVAVSEQIGVLFSNNSQNLYYCYEKGKVFLLTDEQVKIINSIIPISHQM